MKQNASKIAELVFFLLIMLFTFYAVFGKNDLKDILSSIRRLDPFYFLCAAFSAIFFVCMEGFMIWQLLRLTENGVSLLRCFSYSFIGHRRTARPIAGYEKGRASTGQQYFLPYGSCPFL